MEGVLFRGRAIVGENYGEWIYGVPVWTGTGEEFRAYIVSGFEYDDYQGASFENWCLVDPETITQYIQVDDHKGRKIFVGDVLDIDGELVKVQFVVHNCLTTESSKITLVGNIF